MKAVVFPLAASLLAFSFEGGWSEWMSRAMEQIADLGWMGWIWFIVLYVLTCVFFLPGSVLTIGAGAVYGWIGGTLLVTIASTVGAIVNFVTSRYLARNWMEKRLGTSPKLAALEGAIGRGGGRLILLSRVSPVVPHSLVSYAAGLTRISFMEFTVSSFLGFLPLSLAYAYAGAVLGKLARAHAGLVPHDITSWTLTILGFVATIAVVVLSIRASAKAMRQAQEANAAEEAPFVKTENT